MLNPGGEFLLFGEIQGRGKPYVKVILLANQEETANVATVIILAESHGAGLLARSDLAVSRVMFGLPHLTIEIGLPFVV